MCGICGELRLDGVTPDTREVREMRDRLVHRGPDSDGLFVAPEGHGALAFRRLRIIDLTANASQPMANEDGSVRVVFNGEIYNFQELRRQLVARGHTFRSQSDTETIVHLYEDRGAHCIEALDGMFAIAIWDARARRLTLARDRMGKKPLFFYQSDRVFAFASEIKAFFGHPGISIDIDEHAVPYYFLHGYVPGPQTLYRNVRQVEPGSMMTIDETGTTSSRRYWQLVFPRASEVNAIAREDAVTRVRQLVSAAVERRLISDVPLGAFLSGGLDSTIVVGVMSRLIREPVKTFSVGFEGDAAYDETAYARMAADAFKTDHTEFRVSPSAVDLIDTLLWHHDGPFGDSSAVPTYLISKLTREHVTVVLTGDGGDELFAGYDRFYAALLGDRLPSSVTNVSRALFARLPAPTSDRHWITRGRRFLRSAALPLEERITAWNALFFDDLFQLLTPDFVKRIQPIDRLRYLRDVLDRTEGRSPLSRLLHINFASYLPDDLLVKTDRCTMANSLEARAPFLDRELVEYVTGLPDGFKLSGRRTKVVLREAFADLVPPAIANRRKMGFGVPLGAWFRGDLRDYVRDLLLDPNARFRTMLSADFVKRLVERHVSGQDHFGHQLWSLICFERWLRLLPDWRTRAIPPSAPQSAHPPLASSRR